MKSLNIYKNVKGLAKYVSKNILPILNTAESQTVKDVVECLEKKIWQTRLEKFEELVSDWMKFKEDDLHDEDDFILTMKRF